MSMLVNRFRGCVIAAAWCISATMVSAAEVDTRKEITLRQIAPMEFGIVTGGDAGGSATIDARSGGRTSSGNVSTLGGTYGQAEFEITGQPGEEVTVLLPDEITLDNRGGAGTMTLSRFTCEPQGVIRLDQEGRGKVRVGATASLKGSTPQGDYNGIFTIDVRYLR